MNALDWTVLLGTMIAIALYGVWRTRGRHNLSDYLRTDRAVGWGTIGISVMATQASAITFLSTPGQGYESGLGFVQNYFGLPLALILIAAVFVPIYRRLKVFTAYEYLGRRFDSKTRLLGAGLFLVQRGLAAGITVYAPAIVLSTVLGWRLDATIVLTGVFVLIYTAVGGNEAVNVTQKWQTVVIWAGMFTALTVLLTKLPAGLGFGGALTVAGGFGRLEAVDFAINFDKRYTFWSGLLGGVFLSLSYFGTDQSQVQRYLSGTSLRESRLGLMFNAVVKIPMQFFILLLGVLVFVFYQFNAAPVFFNRPAWDAQARGAAGPRLQAVSVEYDAVQVQKRARIEAWLAAHRTGDASAEVAAKTAMLAAHQRGEELRGETKKLIAAADPRAQTNDADYVFITFILDHLPHGAIGLLIAVIFAATLSSKAGELNALGTTTVVDFYRHLRPGAADAHYVRAAKWFTALWGAVAIAFALFANLVENLIQAVNILGSVFYGVVLGLFLVAFFLKRVGGTAVFVAALAAQALVFILYATLSISYLWYNLIGCGTCVAFSLGLHGVLGGRDHAPHDLPA